MANSQPANQQISVFRRLRTQRADRRHESIKSILSPGLRPLVLVVPGEEVQIVRTYDDFRTDRYWRGHAIYVNNRARDSYADAVSGISDIEVPFQLGRDKFINKDEANRGDDLHQEARDLS